MENEEKTLGYMVVLLFLALAAAVLTMFLARQIGTRPPPPEPSPLQSTDTEQWPTPGHDVKG